MIRVGLFLVGPGNVEVHLAKYHFVHEENVEPSQCVCCKRLSRVPHLKIKEMSQHLGYKDVL